jgi:hypothetical protein
VQPGLCDYQDRYVSDTFPEIVYTFVSFSRIDVLYIFLVPPNKDVPM